MQEQYKQINKCITDAGRVVIIQADNPDGDSLGSALALEQILGDMDKAVSLYCGVDIPDYLKHLNGWDRVSKEIPHAFDASIIVDTSAKVLLEKLEQSQQRAWVASKPVIVLDHHAGVECDIPYATVVLNDGEAVATGEVIYKLASQLNWPLNIDAKSLLTSSILSDSLGLSSVGTTPQTYRIVADMIESGVDRAALEEARREYNKMPTEIFRYKADLIRRSELVADGRIASVTIPQAEINEYSPLYNPAPLIQGDMLQTVDVLVAVVFKTYNDGRITASIRCNSQAPVAADIAAKFGGGGHAYASGFKDTSGRPFDDIKSECVKTAQELLAKLDDKGSA